MEAVVLAEGVRFAWEVVIYDDSDVVFESDSKIASNAVLGNTAPPIAIANVIMGDPTAIEGVSNSTSFIYM